MRSSFTRQAFPKQIHPEENAERGLIEKYNYGRNDDLVIELHASLIRIRKVMYMTIKELREKNNLSQAKLAKELGVSPTTISSIESGRLKVNQKIADAVKNVYDVVIEVDPKAEKKVKDAKAAAEEVKEKATIASIETKAIADEIAVEAAEKVEEKAKKVQQTKAKTRATKKKAETKAAEVVKKAEETKAAAEELKAEAEAVAAETAVKAEKAVKKVQKTRAKAKEPKKTAETKAPKAAEKKAPAKKPTTKKPAAKKPAEKNTEVIIQSPMGGEITPEMILAKVGEVDAVYVRVDQNKAYWVKGEERGAVELW